MQNIETKLNELLGKKAPVQLPANARKALADNLHWLTLFGGVLAALAAWNLYQLAAWVAGISNVSMQINPYATPYRDGTLEFFVWLGIAVLALEAVLYFIAFSPLKARKKTGWNILYYAVLLNVIYAFAYFFSNTNVGSLIFSLLGTFVGLYMLFQIRDAYLGTTSTTRPSGTTTTTPKTPTSTKS